MYRIVLLLSLTLLCTACGLKGDLYLPETSPVVVTPAADSSSSSSSQSSQATP